MNTIFNQNILDAMFSINVDSSCKDILLDFGYIFDKSNKNLKRITVPLSCIANGCTLSFGKNRFGVKSQDKALSLGKVAFKLSDNDAECYCETVFNGQVYKLNKSVDFYQDNYTIVHDMGDDPLYYYLHEVSGIIPVYTEEDGPDDYIINLYKERHKIKDAIKMILLGIYLPKGYDKHPDKPCVVLFTKNIRNAANQLNVDFKFNLSEDLAYSCLYDFVENHELAHAFFNKDQKNHLASCDIFIEECLANYAALLSSKHDSNTFKMGKALVERQAKLNSFNPGYNYALQLFDSNFDPKLIGWWKWRYCHELKENVDYTTLSKINDLAEIFDIKGLKFE